MKSKSKYLPFSCLKQKMDTENAGQSLTNFVIECTKEE